MESSKSKLPTLHCCRSQQYEVTPELHDQPITKHVLKAPTNPNCKISLLILAKFIYSLGLNFSWEHYFFISKCYSFLSKLIVKLIVDTCFGLCKLHSLSSGYGIVYILKFSSFSNFPFVNFKPMTSLFISCDLD